MAKELKPESRDELDHEEETLASLKSNRDLLKKIHHLILDQPTNIQGLLILILLVSLSSMIMLIILMVKINEYGC